MTQPADPPVIAKPVMDDATAIAAAKNPPAQTRTITVKPAPYDTPGAFAFRFYKADAHGATPLEWRCVVSGPGGVNLDVALSELGIDAPDAMLARLHLAAVSA